MPTKRRVLTREAARRIVAEQCIVPSATPRIGLELEFLTFSTADAGRPDIGALDAIAADPLASGGRVTCEPGGQLEVSSPPRASAAAAIAVATADAHELTARAAAAGIELLAVGADRWRPPRRVVTSCRYDAMEAHFDASGPHGRRMMCNTAALQLNVDAPANAAEQCWRVANDIGPAMLAAFANSPDGSGWRSARMRAWLGMEQTRTGPVVGRLPGAWADYALAAPALVGRGEDGGCLPLPAAMSFGEWVAAGASIGYPTADDLRYHLTMLFPPVRPRGWLEIRYLDALPSPWWEVAVHVVAALLRSDVLADARGAVAGTETLWREAAQFGLDDDRLAHAADRCFAMALDATGEPAVADYLERYVARRVPAWA